jgi:putative aldouronate transport system substrate-binding protein
MWKKITLTAAAAAILTGSLAGCGAGSDQIAVGADGKTTVSIMTAAYQPESASDDASKNPVMAQAEEELSNYVGTPIDLTIRFAASSNYGEKVTAAMGAGTYPNIMKVPDRTSAIVQNCRGGTFWDITDLITAKNDDGSYKYPNLAKANEEVLHNMSVDGRVYGLYSSRDLGRNGVTIRKDWLEKIGYSDYPKTLDEFYDVCKKFTENDPDGNGIDDTFGMILTSNAGPINQITVWAGAPNGYGIKDGKLTPAFMYDEYLDGLKFIKDLCDKGYVNGNWATMDAEKWNEPMLNGEGGIIIDVADRARRVQTNIKDRNPNAVIGVFGSVAKDENSERRVLPTTGYNGFFVFPKESVKTEEELDLCMKVMDGLESPAVADTLQYGIEGRHYTINSNGEYVKAKKEDGTDDKSNDKEFADLNQILTFISGESNLNIPYASKVAKEVDEVLEDNINYTVSNPAAPYISKTASLKGTALDDIITEANTKFIMGEYDEAKWKSEVERWRIQGGDKVIEELNEAYQADTSVEK